MPLSMILLGLWMLLFALFGLTNITTVFASNIILGVVAILCAVCIFARK